MEVLLIIILALLGAWVSRMTGGGPPQFPFAERQIDLLLWASLPTTAAWFASGNIYVTIGVLALSFWAKSRGHGSYMRMGRQPWVSIVDGVPKKDNEWSAFILNALGFPNDMNHYWRAFTGKTLNGLILLLPIVSVAAYYERPDYLFLLLASFGVPLSYELGWRLNDLKFISADWATHIGEYGRGFFVWGAVAIIMV